MTPLARVDDEALIELGSRIPTPCVLVRATSVGEVIDANAAACALFGRSRLEMLRLVQAELCDPADARVPEARTIVERQGAFSGELRLVRGDGTIFPAELTATFVPRAGAEGRLWIAVKDLTAERRAALLEGRLRTALDASSEAFFLLEADRDEAGRVIDFVVVEANPAAVALVSTNAGSLVGVRLGTLSHVVAQGEIDKLSLVLESRVPLRDDMRTVRAGAPRWIQRHAFPVGDDTVAVTLTDVTELRSALDALREREDELVALSDATMEALFVHQDGVILATNHAARTLYRLPADGAVGRKLIDFIAPEGMPVVARHIAAKSAEPYESVALRADGTRFPAAVQARTITFRGRPARLAAIRDLTSERRLQASLALAERMATVGRLAAGVAHEINNPLAFVLLGIELAQRKLAGPVDGAVKTLLVDTLHDVKVGAERVQAIVRDLRMFSRANDDANGPVEIAAVLDYAARIAAVEIKPRARLTIALTDVPPVVGNETRLGQVFLNLLLNAAQSIAPGDIERNHIDVRAHLAADGRVEVAISDTGSGIPPELLGRVFEPFVSTKTHGSGLGLAICHNIVVGAGGSIEVESEVGRGTTFRVRLPAAVRTGPPAPSEPRLSERAPRRLRLAIVDDEPMLRALAAEVLAPEHDAVPMGSAREALGALERGERFDLVLCDLVMPEMGGDGFFREVAARFPDHAARVVLMTGGAFTPEAAAFVEEGTVRTLSKPFTLEELREIVATAPPW